MCRHNWRVCRRHLQMMVRLTTANFSGHHLAKRRKDRLARCHHQHQHILRLSGNWMKTFGSVFEETVILQKMTTSYCCNWTMLLPMSLMPVRLLKKNAYRFSHSCKPIQLVVVLKTLSVLFACRASRKVRL